MKISKLFHWLYAILMFLPILVFIPNAFYYGFNEQAVAQEKTEQVPIYYESNEVNSLSDIIIGNIYHWSNDYQSQGTISESKNLVFCSYCNIVPSNASSIVIYMHTSGTLRLYYVINGTGYTNDINLQQIDFIPSRIENINLINQQIINRITKSDLQIIKEYQPLTTNMSITDSMSYAWKSTWQNDLFNWSYDSFLTQPFIYITNLFNVPSTNTLLYCLSYWLNISIIWLCFDVVMYVPLLVHRWLDKGIVE